MKNSENKTQATGLPEGVTPEMVKAWKDKYGEGNIHLLTVRAKSSDEKHLCIVRTPDRIVMKRISSYLDEPVKASELLLDECFLGGDETIKTDEALFYGAAKQVSELKEQSETEIVKL